MYSTTKNGRALARCLFGAVVLDLGHGRKQIADAISKAAHELDFAPTFQFAHPSPFELANRIAARRRKASIMFSSSIPDRKPAMPR